MWSWLWCFRFTIVTEVSLWPACLKAVGWCVGWSAKLIAFLATWRWAVLCICGLPPPIAPCAWQLSIILFSLRWNSFLLGEKSATRDELRDWVQIWKCICQWCVHVHFIIQQMLSTGGQEFSHLRWNLKWSSSSYVFIVLSVSLLVLLPLLYISDTKSSLSSPKLIFLSFFLLVSVLCQNASESWQLGPRYLPMMHSDTHILYHGVLIFQANGRNFSCGVSLAGSCFGQGRSINPWLSQCLLLWK